MDERRRQRISGDIREAISQIIARSSSDPRLQLVSISRVKLSRDGSHASVFYETAGDADQRRESCEAVDSASGFIRRNLASMVHTRTVPVLSFVHDVSGEEGDRVLGMIEELK